MNKYSSFFTIINNAERLQGLHEKQDKYQVNLETKENNEDYNK